jgi:hypothetical protein
MTQAIPIGRLLRAGTPGFVVGCRVTQLDSPSFGALVKAPAGEGYEIFGLIYDIHVDDDGLVRQLVTAEGVDENVINDNRLNRNVPLDERAGGGLPPGWTDLPLAASAPAAQPGCDPAV